MSDLRTSLRIASGVILWATHFTAIYGATALACARDAASLVPWAVGGATVVAGALAIVVVVREWRLRERFESWLAAAIAAISLIAIAWEGMTVLVVPPCV